LWIGPAAQAEDAGTAYIRIARQHRPNLGLVPANQDGTERIGKHDPCLMPDLLRDSPPARRLDEGG